jgi:hypothetical protein
MAWPTKTDFVDGDVLTAAQVNNIGTNLNLANPTGITDGYVLTANGAGSMGWEAIPASGGYTSIASGTFTNGATTLTLSSIPGSYKHLYLVVTNLKFTASSPVAQLRINNVSSANTYRYLRNMASTSSVVTNTATVTTMVEIAPGIAAGNSLGFQVFFPEYTQINDWPRRFSWYYGSDNNDCVMGVGQMQNAAAAITRLDILASTSNFNTGNYVLYGVN